MVISLKIHKRFSTDDFNKDAHICINLKVIFQNTEPVWKTILLNVFSNGFFVKRVKCLNEQTLKVCGESIDLTISGMQ